MGQMKKLLLAVFVCVIGVLGTGQVQAYAADFTEAKIATMKDSSELETIDAIYTQTCALENSSDVKEDYFSFTLKKDSWVYLSASYSQNVGDASTTIAVYTNSSMSNKKTEYGAGWFASTKRTNGFWKAGTYYVYVRTKIVTGSTFSGNLHITGGAIPTDKIFTYTTKVSKKKNSATVTMKCAIGSDYLNDVQFRPDTKGAEDVNNSSYWKTVSSSYKVNGDSSTQVLDKENGGYSATVTKNGKVTFLITTTSGDRYAATYKVSGIDTTKPTVSGVKNGKTYKKAVTIKFSDKGSGIKSAKLNGKTIKSGKKVSKKGTYKLVVTDKAGNKNTVKFTIKK